MTNDPLVDLISTVVDVLEHTGVRYAITGSVASSIHGEPYTSQDIDFVVRMTPDQARQIAIRLPQRFYRSEQALIEAARLHGLCSLIDADTGLKVDLSVLSPGAFHDGILEHSRPTEFGPGAARFKVVSPEDIILMKLVWRKNTRSTKQWENALGVARVQGARLDWQYLREQARSLGIENDLDALRDEAGI